MSEVLTKYPGFLDAEPEEINLEGVLQELGYNNSLQRRAPHLWKKEFKALSKIRGLPKEFYYKPALDLYYGDITRGLHIVVFRDILEPIMYKISNDKIDNSLDIRTIEPRFRGKDFYAELKQMVTDFEINRFSISVD